MGRDPLLKMGEIFSFRELSPIPNYEKFCEILFRN